MEEEINIKITQEDIDKGKYWSAAWCPIARSLRRDGYKRISVEDDCIKLQMEGKNKRRVYRSPCGAVRFVRKFDAGAKVTPLDIVIKEYTCERS